jgi:hypothetical protein
LLEGKLGILALLNEECLVPRGSDQNFLNKTINQCKTHPCFPTTNSSTTTLVGSASHHVNRDEFTVLHYAGRVSYHASGFLERNRDAVPFELSQLMGVSSNSVVRDSYAGGGVASTPMQQSTPGAPGNASPAPGAGGQDHVRFARTCGTCRRQHEAIELHEGGDGDHQIQGAVRAAHARNHYHGTCTHIE